MAAPTRVTSGSTILINDLNQLIDLFEGAASMTEAFKFVSSAGENFIVKLSDAAGVRKFSIQDSAGVEVAYINSDGSLVISGSFTPTGALMLPASAGPSDTTDASIQWDSDDNRIVVGDGSSTQTFFPGNPSSRNILAWKNASQVFTTDTTYADITANGGQGHANTDFSFAIGASEIWSVQYKLYVTYGGTGGVKLQLTGPASPTQIISLISRPNGDTDTTGQNYTSDNSGTGTSFGQLHAQNSANNAMVGGVIYADVVIVNGANAGTVVLQGAQNSANSTTTFNSGSYMVATKIS